jgi:hypothetical protein
VAEHLAHTQDVAGSNPAPAPNFTPADLHAAGAAYWGLACRRELGRVKHVPQANPNKAVALAALAGHHGLKALGITFDRPSYERESDASTAGPAGEDTRQDRA